MAATDTGPAADAGHDGTDDERLTRLENAVDRIEQAVAGLPPTHAEAQAHEAAKLDRPSNVQEQARAAVEQALADRDKKAADAKNADAARAREQSLHDRLAALEEKPPAPPRLRRTRLLGWGDGRG